MKGKGAFENSICMLDDSSTSDRNSGNKSLFCNLKHSGRMESIPFEVNDEFIISLQIRLINQSSVLNLDSRDFMNACNN